MKRSQAPSQRINGGQSTNGFKPLFPSQGNSMAMTSKLESTVDPSSEISTTVESTRESVQMDQDNAHYLESTGKISLHKAFRMPTSLHNSLSYQAPAMSNPAEDSEIRFFEVFWTKQSKKKHKVWDDGVLIVKNGSYELQSQDGSTISKGLKTVQGSALQEANFIYFGNNECEIVKEITEDEYIQIGAASIATTTTKASCSRVKNAPFRKVFDESKILSFDSSTEVEKDIPSKNTSSEIISGSKAAKNFTVDPSRQHAYILNDDQKDQFLVVLDPVLGMHMKPHQVAGVKFLYKTLMRKEPNSIVSGCILADEMGLGKTLQSIALIWSLMKQSPYSLTDPVVRKAIIVCPSSLVFNWANEIKKWLGDQRLKAQAITKGGMNATNEVHDFVKGNVKRVLIISYDMLRRHIQILSKYQNIQLVVCDEGQKLKNIDGNKTIDSLNALSCRMRILLSGTPVQNDLDEFYAMVNWVCPGTLGAPKQFRKIFADAIVKSRDKSCSKDMQRIGKKRLRELIKRTSPIILRRTSQDIVAQMPSKYERVIFCRPSPLQKKIYKTLLSSSELKKAIEGNSGQVVFTVISKLTKALNHPDLVTASLNDDENASNCSLKINVNVRDFFPAEYEPLNPCHSGKLQFLFRLLEKVKASTTDRIVIVSNYTTSLDFVDTICKKLAYKTVRLDGSTEISKRSDIVSSFNNPSSGIFIFLLSSKAGGVGLNLIGGNRIILLDPSWNPAHDLQAMARVWRFGQSKPVFVYRLLTTGTIEERIFQKQIRKGELESLIIDDAGDANRHFDQGDLKDIFVFSESTTCDTYDLLAPTLGKPDESDGQVKIAGYTCLIGSGTSIHEMDQCCQEASNSLDGTVSFVLFKETSPTEINGTQSNFPKESTACSSSSDSDEDTGIQEGDDETFTRDEDIEGPVSPKRKRVRAKYASEDEGNNL
eukprot:755246-Hanusia_phi.AAC.2